MTRLPTLPMPRLPSLPGMSDYGYPTGIHRAPEEPITPEEQQSLWRTILGPIQWLGETIAKPFRATQGVVSGLTDLAQGNEPEWGGGLLNLVPFSDTMGLTNPADMEKTAGRSLLTKWGIAPPEEGKGWGEDWDWKLAGLGVDLLTPGSALGGGPGGALTRAGKLVGKAAKVPKSVQAAGASIKAAMEGPSKTWSKLVEEAGGDVGAAAATRASQGPILGANVKAMANEVREELRGAASIQPLGGGVLSLLGLNLPKIPLGVGSERAAKALEGLAYGKYSPFAWLGYLASSTTAGTWPGPEMAARAETVAKFANVQAATYDALPALSKGMDELQGMWANKIGGYAKAAGNNRGFADADDVVNYLWEMKGKLPEGGVFQNVPGELGQQVAEFQELSQTMADSLANVDSYIGLKYKMLGGNLEFLDDIHVKHSPRRPSAELKKAFDELEARRQYKTGAGGFAMHRDPAKSQPGGTHSVNAAAMDQLLSGTDRLTKAEKEVVEESLRSKLAAKGVPIAPDATLADLQRQYAYSDIFKPARDKLGYAGDEATQEALAEWEKSWLQTVKDKEGNIIQGGKGDDLIAQLNKLPAHAQEHGIFDRATITDWLDYLTTMSASTSNLMSIHNLMRQTAKIADKADTAPPSGFLTLDQAWSAAVHQKGKLKGRPLLNDGGKTTFLDRFAQDLVAKDPNALAQFDIQVGSQNYVEELTTKLAPRVLVPSKLPRVLGNWFQLMEPETHSAVGKVWDGINSAFKTGVTAVWPAFHVRNLIDDFWRQAANAGENYSLGSLIRGYFKTIRDLTRGPSAEMQQAAKSGLFAKGSGIGQDVKALVGSGTGDEMPRMMTKFFEKETAPRAPGIMGSPWMPLNVKGVRGKMLGGGSEAAQEELGKTARQFYPVMWGERAYSIGEAFGRMPTYYAALEAGKTPGQARAIVAALSFNFAKPKVAAVPGNFFDRVISRAVPFANFVQKNVPYQIAQLIDRPTGLTAMTIRGMGLAQRESTDYVPSWMREQLGIRTGGPEENASFFRGMGLSYEGLGPYLPTIVGNVASPGTWSRSAERMFSQTAPPLQLAYKLLSGREPYTGRELKHVKGPFGVPALDTVLTSSPLARAAGSLAELADERKSMVEKLLGLTTGMKLSRFNLPEQKIADTEAAIKAQIQPMKYVREWTEPYVPKKYLEKVDPETLEKLRQLKTLAKQRKRLMAETPKPSPSYSWGLF